MGRCACLCLCVCVSNRVCVLLSSLGNTVRVDTVGWWKGGGRGR